MPDAVAHDTKRQDSNRPLYIEVELFSLTYGTTLAELETEIAAAKQTIINENLTNIYITLSIAHDDPWDYSSTTATARLVGHRTETEEEYLTRMKQRPSTRDQSPEVPSLQHRNDT